MFLKLETNDKREGASSGIRLEQSTSGKRRIYKQAALQSQTYHLLAFAAGRRQPWPARSGCRPEIRNETGSNGAHQLVASEYK